MNVPIVFEPLFMERVWGGRRLETLFGKHLPPRSRIGESWEVVDREDAQSVVHDGPWRGLTLHELWSKHRETLFGTGLPDTARFPLLFKFLDAQERLSVQVHPPAAVAARLGGEPKTEMWYLLDTLLDADIYAGLQPGVTRSDFDAALGQGRVADLVHRVQARPGDAIFIPSGRIHAIGSGNLVFEVQQNSDTTYRVFDWNRLGLDGNPRALHVKESLESIDFHDTAPQVAVPVGETLVECDYFKVERWLLDGARAITGPGFSVFTVLGGEVECCGRVFKGGDFFLAPIHLTDAFLRPVQADASVLRTSIGGQG